MTTYDTHEYANIFPLHDGEAMKELIADMEQHGQQDPIILCEGKILDGRRRHLACQALRREPRCEEYRGDDPLGFVVGRNLHRRHLNDKERALVAARIASLRSGRPETIPPSGGALSVREAAEQLNVSPRAVERAKRVLAHGTPALQQAVKEGDLSLAAGAQIAGLEPEKQPAAVNAAQAGAKQQSGAKEAQADLAERALAVLAKLDAEIRGGRQFAKEVKLLAELEKLLQAIAKPRPKPVVQSFEGDFAFRRAS